VENRDGVEVMKLDAIIEKKTAKEIRSWEGQSALNKILKQNNLLSPSYGLLSPAAEHHWIISLGCRRHSSTSVLRSASEHLLVLHPSPAMAASLESFSFDLVVPFLLTILHEPLHSRSGAEDWGNGAALQRRREVLLTTPNRRGSTVIGLDLNLAAAATRRRKTKGQGSESASERVSKPKLPRG
jgi:hypothetical protein